MHILPQELPAFPKRERDKLILYGMAPLYGRFARDAVLIAAVQHEMYDLEVVNRLLTRCGQPPLVRDYA